MRMQVKDLGCARYFLLRLDRDKSDDESNENGAADVINNHDNLPEEEEKIGNMLIASVECETANHLAAIEYTSPISSQQRQQTMPASVITQSEPRNDYSGRPSIST